MRQFARALLAAGVTKGSSVALMLANRPEFVIAAYGAGSIGAVVVPVSTFAPSDERDYILRHSDASVLVTQASLFNHRFVDELLDSHPELARGRSGTAALDAPSRSSGASSRSTRRPQETVERWDDLVARADEVPDELLDAAMAEVHPHDPGIIIYTSGTSANPKGVLHANGTPAIQSWRWGKALGLTPDDKLLSKFPYFWSAGLTMTLGGPLSAGTAVITIESFDAGTALEIMERERVTALQSMPETYNEIVEHPDFRHARPVGADARRRRRAVVRGDPRPAVARPGQRLRPHRDLHAVHLGRAGGDGRRVPHRPRPAAARHRPEDRRRRDGRGAPDRAARRDRRQGRDVHARLLQGLSRGVPRPERLLPHRRLGPPRRGRRPPLGRPADRHDQDGRRQRVAGRDRVEAVAVGSAEGGHGRAGTPSAARRGRGGLCRLPRRRPGQQRGDPRPPQVGARLLQGPEAGGVRRRARAVLHRHREGQARRRAPRRGAAHRRGGPRVGRAPAGLRTPICSPSRPGTVS